MMNPLADAAEVGIHERRRESGGVRAMMSNMERLVYMANQIARNFATLPQDDAVAAVADHIAHFWDPRMRAMILEHLHKGGEDLSEIAHAALVQLGHGDRARADNPLTDSSDR